MYLLHTVITYSLTCVVYFLGSIAKFTQISVRLKGRGTLSSAFENSIECLFSIEYLYSNTLYSKMVGVAVAKTFDCNIGAIQKVYHRPRGRGGKAK